LEAILKKVILKKEPKVVAKYMEESILLSKKLKMLIKDKNKK